ncbi:MAG: alkaline phosphatase family protein [Vicinamibacterales bacterium]
MRILTALLALVLVSSTTLPLAAQHPHPRLVVLIVVDQMRGDYIDANRHRWTKGLARLVDDGAWFQQADYPFANTVTCAGHASISTGALPSVHGMVNNTWWDRDFGRVVACADDAGALALSYGRPVSASGQSAHRLMVPTLADELRAQLGPDSRVAAFSLKARSVATLGGQHPDVATWIADEGAWVTSTAYGGQVPELARYLAAHPVESELWTTWNRAMPKAAYTDEERALGHQGEGEPAFPHSIRTWDEWEASPLSDAYLGRMALGVVGSMNFGEPGHTDMLAISFSALDLVGHSYGPDSHEVQDVLFMLDQTIGELLTGLDALVGRDNYVVALSSDHGVSQTPEHARAHGVDAARIPPRAIPDAAQSAISGLLGKGRWVNRLMNGDLYLEDGVLARLRSTPDGIERLRSALLAVPGVERVLTRDELTPAAGDYDPTIRPLINSYVPSRSGDVMIVFRPHWLVGTTNGANHGTSYGYDTRVPIILAGAGIKSGAHTRRVTPLDIAPTLAHLAGITLPHAQGQVLIDALLR